MKCVMFFFMYLYFINIVPLCIYLCMLFIYLEYCVYAKKEITVRTKFGPIEGDIKCLLPSELELIKNDSRRALPVLFVNDVRMVDVSNECKLN